MNKSWKLCWVTLHDTKIWRKKINVYVYFTNAKFVLVNSLFVTNMYSGPLIVQSMLLNRRSNDKELLIKKTANEADEAINDVPAGMVYGVNFMLSWFCRIKSSSVIMHQYNQIYQLQVCVIAITANSYICSLRHFSKWWSHSLCTCVTSGRYTQYQCHF